MKPIYLFFFIMSIILFYLGAVIFFTYIGTTSHENAHKQIYSYFGINSTTKVNWDGSGYCQPVENSSVCNDNCQLAHSMNEAVGYNLDGIFNMMVVTGFANIFLLCLIVIHFYKDKGEE